MEQKYADYIITLPKTVLLLLMYIFIGFGFPAIINMVFQNSVSLSMSVWINTFSQTVINIIFFIVLARVTNYKISFTHSITILNILIAIACSILLFLLLDNFFDPIFDKLFPTSEDQYQEMLNTMKLTPIATFIQACLVAPFTEEMLMRGYILHGLKNKYGVVIALFLSTFLFAVLHINIGQILSAFIGGIIIALLYLKTKSISCCILTHILYNSIEYFTTIV